MSAQGTYRFYSVQRQTILIVNGEPLGRERVNNFKNYVPINPFLAEWVLRALIDFTLSNARRFYSSMGNPLDGKGLMQMTFVFVLISVTLKMLWALELQTLTCSVKQLNSSKIDIWNTCWINKIQGVSSDFWSLGLTSTFFHLKLNSRR